MAMIDQDDVAPATHDAYTGMLTIALFVLVGACLLLYFDFSQYSESQPKPLPPLPEFKAPEPLPKTQIIEETPPAVQPPDKELPDANKQPDAKQPDANKQPDAKQPDNGQNPGAGNGGNQPPAAPADPAVGGAPKLPAGNPPAAAPGNNGGLPK